MLVQSGLNSQDLIRVWEEKQEMGFFFETVRSVQVNGSPRMIRTEITRELIQDLEFTYGIDVEAEIIRQMQHEIGNDMRWI